MNFDVGKIRTTEQGGHELKGTHSGSGDSKRSEPAEPAEQGVCELKGTQSDPMHFGGGKIRTTVNFLKGYRRKKWEKATGWNPARRFQVRKHSLKTSRISRAQWHKLVTTWFH